MISARLLPTSSSPRLRDCRPRVYAGRQIPRLLLQERADPVAFSPRVAHLGFFYETSFEHHFHPVGFAVEFVIAVDETDAFDLCAAFDGGRAAFELEVFDQDHRIAVGKNVAVGIFDYQLFFSDRAAFVSLVPTYGALLGISCIEPIVHRTRRTGGHAGVYSTRPKNSGAMNWTRSSRSTCPEKKT